MYPEDRVELDRHKETMASINNDVAKQLLHGALEASQAAEQGHE